MSKYRTHLPQLSDTLFLTAGGLAILHRYFDRYLSIALRQMCACSVMSVLAHEELG